MKFAIYCRKSTDTEDKQLLSLESQEQELLRLAKNENLTVVDVFKESMTAKEPGRPIFNNLLNLFAKGKIDGILCWKIDRLTRNPIDGGQIQWLLQTGKIKCIRTFEKFYYPTDNVLLLNIEQAMATQYIRELSENVKRGNRTKLEKGIWPSKAPFGYRNDKATKTIIVDKKKARYVKRVFDLYASGIHTLQEISNILYDEGLRNGVGNKVAKSHIHLMLSNRFYAGLMERDGKMYQGKHKPIVSVSAFNTVQDILHGRMHPRPKKHFYPARGFLTCAKCGCTLTADTKKGYVYYYCTNGKGICDQHKKYIRAESIDLLVREILVALKFEIDVIEHIAKAYAQKNENNFHNIDDMLITMQTEIDHLKTKESMLVDGFCAEKIPELIYLEKMKTIELKRQELTLQLKEIEAKRGLSQITFEQVKNVFIQGNKAAELYLEGTDPVKRNILSSVLSNIIISDQKIVKYQLKSPYDLLAKTPETAHLRSKLALWDDIGKSLLANPPSEIPIDDNKQDG